ncbi:universal stress protein [Streptomyces virginiae]|uniref:universal stress protein n=1 Tax=Streptomyces virginiae TaxID=1961 RepID=UPI002DDA1D75|nr:universal stress protein [Streptomyces virginiae]WSC75540.1 universal stress protein [Streptomyces virginiae]
MTETLVVGIDGSPESLAAADWAAQEAVRRHAHLHLVHAWPWQHLTDSRTLDRQPEADRAERVVREAEAEVTGRYPDLPVSASLVPEAAVPALLRLAEGAEMLVIGTRGHGALRDFLLGSSGQQIIAAAPCPVVSVRGSYAVAGSPRNGEIVVGHQGDADESRAVLRFAFEVAAARRATLRVVRAWSLPPVYAYSPGSMWLAEQLGGVEPYEKVAMEQALEPWREKFPEVPVIEQVRTGSAGQVLLSAAAGAELLVVGRRIRHCPVGTRIGSVALAALHHAPCPVAVVPHAH